MAAKAKKKAKPTAKKAIGSPARKEVKSSRRKSHQAGLVTKDSPEMKMQRSKGDPRKTGVRKTRKQRDVANQGTPSRSVNKSPRKAAAKKTPNVVRRVRKPSSATTTPAPADAGMPAGLSELGG